ncbi:MAG: phospholipid carrier-dependent glycosyltransferase [Cyanobacteria bacterium P01_H01_bin.15]
MGQNRSTAFKLSPSWCLFLGVTLVYLAFAKPIILGIDGNDMLAVAKSLVQDGNFTINHTAAQPFGALGREGQYYSSRYPLLPILVTPFVAFGLFLDHRFNLPDEFVLPNFTATFAIAFSVLITAGISVLTMLLARRLGAQSWGAYLAGLATAFGTTLLVYGRQFYADPLLTLVTAAGVYVSLGHTNKELRWASVFAGLAVTVKPTGIVLGPVLAFYFVLKKVSWRTALQPLLGTLCGLLIHLGYNYLRFGDWLQFGQNASRFTFDGWLDRANALLFSPGASAGLLWYCPPVLLAIAGAWQIRKSKPLEVGLIMGVFVGYWGLHSFWSFGQWNWGPRFLLPVLPGLLALGSVLRRQGQKWLILLTLVGFLVNGPTLLSFFVRYQYEVAAVGNYQALALWGDWRQAPVFNIWQTTYRQVTGIPILVTDQYRLEQRQKLEKRLGALPSVDVWPTPLMYTIPVWWWTLLPLIGISPWLGLAFAIALLGFGLWLLRLGWMRTGMRERT